MSRLAIGFFFFSAWFSMGADAESGLSISPAHLVAKDLDDSLRDVEIKGGVEYAGFYVYPEQDGVVLLFSTKCVDECAVSGKSAKGVAEKVRSAVGLGQYGKGGFTPTIEVTRLFRDTDRSQKEVHELVEEMILLVVEEYVSDKPFNVISARADCIGEKIRVPHMHFIDYRSNLIGRAVDNSSCVTEYEGWDKRP